MFPFGIRRRGRRAVYAMDVVEQYTLWMSWNSYGGLKLGVLTPHKVTADYLIVPQNKHPLENVIRWRNSGLFGNLHFLVLLLVRLGKWHNDRRLFWSSGETHLCIFSSGGLRLAGPNEDGFPSIRRLEQTQLEDFHPFEGWFSLDSCIDSGFFKS